MVANCFIAADHFHVADLTFTIIVKTSIGQVLVFIAVMTASLAGDDNYNVMVGRSNDATLLLASKLTMNVVSPVIVSAYDKAPSHAYPPV
ncbi:hypothetical protein O206_08775 [Ochrobactrum sp. EGD-AQ16]|nr:hypothetical protein O206_08775 [Ochrobactrum sp. EGD-AQ16]